MERADVVIEGLNNAGLDMVSTGNVKVYVIKRASLS